MADKTPTFDRPTPAKLVIRCANGDEWEPSTDDLSKFGYCPTTTAYARFCDFMAATLGPDWQDGPLSAVRHAVECALFYEHMPDDDEFDELKPLLEASHRG